MLDDDGPEKKEMLYLNLDNFDSQSASKCPYILTSPRSLKACRKANLRPVELLHKSIAEISEKLGLPEHKVYRIYVNTECQRQRKLELCKMIRNEIIKVEESMLNNEGDYTTSRKQKLDMENYARMISLNNEYPAVASTLSSPELQDLNFDRKRNKESFTESTLSASSSLSSLTIYSASYFQSDVRSKSAENNIASKRRYRHRNCLSEYSCNNKVNNNNKKCRKLERPERTKSKINEINTMKKRVGASCSKNSMSDQGKMVVIAKKKTNVANSSTNKRSTSKEKCKSEQKSVKTAKLIKHRHSAGRRLADNRDLTSTKPNRNRNDQQRDKKVDFHPELLTDNDVDVNFDESKEQTANEHRSSPISLVSKCVTDDEQRCDNPCRRDVSKECCGRKVTDCENSRNINDHDLHILEALTMKHERENDLEDMAYRAQLLWDVANEKTRQEETNQKRWTGNYVAYEAENVSITQPMTCTEKNSPSDVKFTLGKQQCHRDDEINCQDDCRRADVTELSKKKLNDYLYREKTAFQKYVDYMQNRLKYLRTNSLYRELHNQHVLQLANELRAGMEQWQDQVLLLQWQALQRAQTNARLHLENRRLRTECENKERALLHAQRMKNIKNLQLMKLRSMKEEIEAKNYKIERLRLKRERELLECRMQAQNISELRQQFRKTLAPETFDQKVHKVLLESRFIKRSITASPALMQSHIKLG